MTPPTAAHCVAHIPELLGQIIAKLLNNGPELARLARVSGVFHEIAIRWLWSGKLGRSDQLLYLFPEGILDITQNESYILRRTPEEPEWCRFQHYSVNTEHLAVDVETWGESLISFLSAHVDAFFPRLAILQVSDITDSLTPKAEWMLLARPSLRTLLIIWAPTVEFLDYPDYADAFSNFWRHVALRTPNLHKLYFAARPSDPPILSLPDPLTRLVCGVIRSLSNLKISGWDIPGMPVPADIVAVLAAHQSITNVSLTKPDNWLALDESLSRFSSLKQLWLHGDGMVLEACTRFITQPLLLNHIDLTSAGTAPYPGTFHIFETATSLRTISVTVGWKSVSWADFRPILHCGSLSTLEIKSHCRIVGFNDSALAELASTLSLLEKLKIAWNIASGGPYEVSLHGLSALVQSTPNLWKLSIECTTRLLHPDQTKSLLQPDPTISDRPPIHLTLVDSEINFLGDTAEFLGPQRAAEILITLWPSLLWGSVPLKIKGRKYSDRWEEVSQILRERSSRFSVVGGSLKS